MASKPADSIATRSPERNHRRGRDGADFGRGTASGAGRLGLLVDVIAERPTSLHQVSDVPAGLPTVETDDPVTMDLDGEPRTSPTIVSGQARPGLVSAVGRQVGSEAAKAAQNLWRRLNGG